MSVLAGAPELVFFNLGDLLAGHPDHQKVAAQFNRLCDLAAALRTAPVAGIPAYKPPNSDPAGDMYLIDFLGMLGIPLVPVHTFPESASVIFLPAQAAADAQLLAHVRNARARGAVIVVTASLLCTAPDADQLAHLAGLDQKLHSAPLQAQLLSLTPESRQRKPTGARVDLETPLEIDAGPNDILCAAGGGHYGLLAVSKRPGPRMAVLNTHTFSQADFDRVGEVLLAPRPLGLLEAGGQPLQALRAAFRGPGDVVFAAPSCVTLHQLGKRDGAASYVIQNFNEHAVSVALTVPLASARPHRFRDAFTARAVACGIVESPARGTLTLDIPPRGRVWIQPVSSPQPPKDGRDRAGGLAAEEAVEGFVPIFDGKSLDGWIGLGGDKSSYYVRAGMLICKTTGKVHPGLKYKQGHISLHAHGNYGAEVFFRNLRVKELP
jgi:hypothetical protein